MQPVVPPTRFPMITQIVDTLPTFGGLNKLGILFPHTTRPKSPHNTLPTQDNCFATTVVLEIFNALHQTFDH